MKNAGFSILKLKLLFKIIQAAFSLNNNPIAAISATRKTVASIQGRSNFQPKPFFKRVGDSYIWNLNIPSYPSKSLDRMIEKEVAISSGKISTSLNLGIVAITNKCSLNCEHCFEWDNLNRQNQLDLSDISGVIGKLNSYGVSQIWFTGGEPMNKFELLCSAISDNNQLPIDYWVVSSGFGLNEKKAVSLKLAGAKGVVISLDHYVAEKHDLFRGVTGSYQAATNALLAAQKAGLLTAVSLCAINDMTQLDQLRNYLDLVKELGVEFIQILEPKSEGRYQNKDVQLTLQEKESLEYFFLSQLEMAHSGNEGPIISYPDYQKRMHGCLGGKRYLYVDTNGDVHACPFCKSSNPVSFLDKQSIPLTVNATCSLD